MVFTNVGRLLRYIYMYVHTWYPSQRKDTGNPSTGNNELFV